LADVVSGTHAVEKLQGIRMVSVILNRERLFATRFVHSLIHEKNRGTRCKSIVNLWFPRNL
jgi:hypothetical protein